MALLATYDTEDSIPEAHRELFTERDGKFELTGIEGIKTQGDVDRVNEALVKERKDHKETKGKLTIWGELEHEQVTKDLDELAELRIRIQEKKAAGENTEVDEEKLEKLVEARVATQVTPLNRELEKLRKENADKDVIIGDFQHKDTIRTITDAVRKAGVTSKVIDTAMDDVLMLSERVFEVTEGGEVLTKDEVGCTPGITADIWLSEMQEKRPHWWPRSEGGGSTGSGNGDTGFANNPFKRETWNLTKQGELLRSDRTKAERMAKAAGTTIGAGMPPAAKKAAS